MNKLLKYSGDIKKALRTVNAKMDQENYDYVTWSNAQTGARFIAQKSTVEKMYNHKFNGGPEADSREVVKITNSSLTLNEMKECGSGAVLKEGFGGKEVAKITFKEINLLEEILYNDSFDCSILFD